MRIQIFSVETPCPTSIANGKSSLVMQASCFTGLEAPCHVCQRYMTIPGMSMRYPLHVYQRSRNASECYRRHQFLYRSSRSLTAYQTFFPIFSIYSLGKCLESRRIFPRRRSHPSVRLVFACIGCRWYGTRPRCWLVRTSSRNTGRVRSRCLADFVTNCLR